MYPNPDPVNGPAAVIAQAGASGPADAFRDPGPAAIEAARTMLRGRPGMREMAREAYTEASIDQLQRCAHLAGVRVIDQGEHHQTRRPFAELSDDELAIIGRCAGLLVGRGEDSPAPMAELRRLRLLAYL